MIYVKSLYGVFHVLVILTTLVRVIISKLYNFFVDFQPKAIMLLLTLKTVCGCEPTVNVNMRYRIYRQNKDVHAGRSYQKHPLGVGNKRRKKEKTRQK